ncbi:hypothetical protein [Chryseobacterium arthrosphaerae]|uniref:hypothetical protein n=1 Tax=Chryseobacterium arthrosphaerae TaxID=651561 RepID=UPI00241D7D72|nr:hypothetical protein [Chryseobacterium arthrosphaerae]
MNVDNIIQVIVNNERSAEFKSLISKMGEIINVVEVTRGELLLYIIKAEHAEHAEIKEMGFMSFIKNQKLQKYYK